MIYGIFAMYIVRHIFEITVNCESPCMNQWYCLFLWKNHIAL